MSGSNILKYSFLFLFLFILISCKPVETDSEIEGFSICLGEFPHFDQAELFKSKLDIQLWSRTSIKSEEERHLLLIGNFDSSFDAGNEALDLFRKGLITNYKIYEKGKFVYDDFTNVMFVARFQGRPSVYSYNMMTRQSRLFWSRWGRKVISLNHSADRSYLFFVTALGYGKQGSFSYVRDARAYRFKSSAEEVDELTELGTGLQIYTYWDAKDTFKVNFTKPDSINSDILIQEISSYLYDGKVIDHKKRTFSLTREGFPKPPSIQPRLLSGSMAKSIRLARHENLSYIYLRDLKEGSEVLIGSFSGELFDAKWSVDDNHLFLIVRNRIVKRGKTEEQHDLMIIDTALKKLVRTFHSNYYQNLLVHGNFLFFDSRSGTDSFITIYDYQNDDVFDEIRLPGGCGINNL